MDNDNRLLRRSKRINKPNFSASCPSSSRKSKKSAPLDGVMISLNIASHPKTAADSLAKEELIEEIKDQYLIAKEKYDEEIATDGYDVFQEIFEPGEATPLEIPFVEVPELDPVQFEPEENVAKFVGPNKIRKLNVSYFKSCPHPPKMKYWINTNVNIVGKDQLYLNNCPYFGEEHDDFAQINDDLPELFPEGIHGDDVGWEKPINDWLLFNTCNPIMKKHQWNNDEDLERLMASMHQLFPNKGSLKEMISSYQDMVRKYDPENATFSNRHFDGNGRIAGHFSPEALQNTNTSLICKRCFDIDCIHHPIVNFSENDAHVKRRDDERIAEIKEACGEDCYKISKSNDAAEWTSEEKAWVDSLLAANIEQICRISQFLVNNNCSKTCKQVHDYLKVKEPLALVVYDENRIDGNDRRLPVITQKGRAAFRKSHRGQLTNSFPYQSCKHHGSCTIKNGCSCKDDKIVCTKLCACPTTCTSRFPGCRCSPGTCNTRSCECYLASFECDPDLCRGCNCDGDEKDGKQICCNTYIQRGFMRKLYAGRSKVAGTGCFTSNFIPKDGFIGEYCGEIITHDEAERRGRIYDAYQCSYLFDINEVQTLDAGRYGNILRFINHAKNPNCRPKVLTVNGDHRVGFFALKDIEANEELFFDYAYSSDFKAAYNFVE